MAVKPSSFFVESWEDNLDDEEFFNPLEPDIRFKHLSKKVLFVILINFDFIISIR